MTLSTIECDRRKREAFKARGIDYDEYCRAAEQKKAEIASKKLKNIESSMYHPNHEDNVQFGCCYADTAFEGSFQLPNLLAFDIM